MFDDANGDYMGFDGKVHVAEGYTQYANFSLWDIYRSEVQLLALLAPQQTSDMVTSLAGRRRPGRRPSQMAGGQPREPPR